jgi:hypothetical protein
MIRSTSRIISTLVSIEDSYLPLLTETHSKSLKVNHAKHAYHGKSYLVTFIAGDAHAAYKFYSQLCNLTRSSYNFNLLAFHYEFRTFTFQVWILLEERIRLTQISDIFDLHDVLVNPFKTLTASLFKWQALYGHLPKKLCTAVYFNLHSSDKVYVDTSSQTESS